MNDLQKAGLPPSSLSLIGGPDSASDNYEKTELASLGMPDKDYDHLKAGLRSGGYVVSVTCTQVYVGQVEKIFGAHRAEKIDEADVTPQAVATNITAGQTAIPIVEEELEVGKRTVDTGGVRVYRRVVEIPVEENVALREEHVHVNRVAVDRDATDKDFAFGDRSIELTETAEEAVVGKSARVVEEVLVSKGVTEHTETITDTVRKTEVEVEKVPATGTAVTSATRPTGQTF